MTDLMESLENRLLNRASVFHFRTPIIYLSNYNYKSNKS
nr:MAG TPA: hypothetical protein [Caudoviricetes sp.]